MGRAAEERRAELIKLYRELQDCHDCPLAATRTNVVFGSGNADADLMFVGEAPGFHEDQQGKPFVGAAGKLLDKLLAEIGLEREQDAFIANVLMCRPPGNRDPEPEEIEECKPYLMQKIRLIEPRVICTLGNFATKCITGRPEGITRAHGRPQERVIEGLPLVIFPLFHPAAGLRSGAVLTQLRDDFQKLPELIATARPKAAAPPAPPAAGPPEPAMMAAEPPQLGLFG
ncbi:MAG TPA: uracil-DNA glycosylase [Thermoleophilaceae bacterium]